MITYHDQTFNSWNDVVKKFPAMWVVFDKVKFDGSSVKAGNIWVVLPNDEIISFENKNFGKYALSLRTTDTVTRE